MGCLPDFASGAAYVCNSIGYKTAIKPIIFFNIYSLAYSRHSSGKRLRQAKNPVKNPSKNDGIDKEEDKYPQFKQKRIKQRHLHPPRHNRNQYKNQPAFKTQAMHGAAQEGAVFVCLAAFPTLEQGVKYIIPRQRNARNGSRKTTGLG